MSCSSCSKPTPAPEYNVIRAVKDVVTGRAKYASGEVQRQRKQICGECKDQFVLLTGICKICGCFINTKVMFSAANCPIGKW
jgi:hypothetical protein